LSPTTANAAEGRRGKIARGHLAALVLFFALACVQLWPLPARLLDGLVGLSQDGLPNSDLSIFLWDFWWVRKSLVELHQSPAFCNWLGQPGPATFVFPTLSLQNSLAALPLMGLVAREAAYNILILVILALTGWSAYLLVSDLAAARKSEAGVAPGNALGTWLAAVAAGLLYGTTALQVRHVGQINVFTLFWMPLVLMAGRRFLATGRAAPAIALGAFFLCNMLAEWYHAVELTILLVLLAAIAVWRMRTDRVRSFEKKWWPLFAVWGLVYAIGGQFNVFVHFGCWLTALLYLFYILIASQDSAAMQRLARRLAAGVVVTAAFAAPVAWPMYRSVQKEAWLRDVKIPAKAVFSADLASYVMPGKAVERLFPSDLPPILNIYGARASGASDVFPGFVAWAMLLAAVVWRTVRGRRGGEWLLLAAVFLLLSLGMVLKFGGLVRWTLNPAEQVLLPAVLFEFIGVLEGIRVFLRFAFGAYLCAAIFIGIQTTDWLATLKERRARRWAVAGLAVAAGLLVVERLELPQPVSRVPFVAAFEWLRRQPGGTVLLCPVVRNQYQNLYSQTLHEKPMVNPYVSRRPEDVAERVTSSPLLLFLENPRSEASRALLKTQPDLLYTTWRELVTKTGGERPSGLVLWLVVDRHAYRPQQLAEIEWVLSAILRLAPVFEDEQFSIYQERWRTTPLR